MPTFNSARVAVPQFLTIHVGDSVWVPVARASGEAVRGVILRLDNYHGGVAALVRLEDGSTRHTRRLLPLDNTQAGQCEACVIFDLFHGPNLSPDAGSAIPEKSAPEKPPAKAPRKPRKARKPVPSPPGVVLDEAAVQAVMAAVPRPPAECLKVSEPPVPKPGPRCPPAPPIAPTPGTTPGWWAEDEPPVPKRRRSM